MIDEFKTGHWYRFIGDKGRLGEDAQRLLADGLPHLCIDGYSSIATFVTKEENIHSDWTIGWWEEAFCMESMEKMAKVKKELMGE